VKICHITTVHQSRDVRIFHKECKSLAKAGYDVSLLVINGETFSEDGVKVQGIPCKFSNRLQRFLKASKTVYRRALEINAEIYHFHDPEFLPYAAKLVRKGKKVIYDVHEDLPRQIYSKYYINKFLRRITGTFVEFFEDYLSRKMSFIFTATPYIRDRFLKKCKNVAAINNYPLMQETEPIKKNLGKNAICYVGGISKIRGLNEVVKGLEKTDTRLNLAGDFSPGSYYDKLTAIDGWDKVNFIGFASRSKVREIFAESFAGIVTFHPELNHINSQPNKLFEYMSAGLPLIASNFPAWKEIVEGNNCGRCIDPLNPEEIAGAINWLQNHPDEALEMGANGRQAVLNKYNWQNEEKKLLKIYNNLK